jgi:hypothetical protein
MTLFLWCFSSISLAHTLLYESSTTNGATAVYLDELTRKVVVKKYNWTKEFISQNGGKVSVKFPKTVKSLSSVYSPFFDNYEGVTSSMDYVDLNQESKRINLKLISHVDDETGKFDVNKTSKAITEKIGKSSPYKVIGDKTRGGKRNIVLINPVTGHLLIQKGRRRDIDIASLQSIPKDLKKYFSNSTQTERDLSSPGKIQNYLTSVKRDLNRLGIDSSNSSDLMKEIANLNKNHSDKISKMRLVKSVGKKGEEKQLFMNTETGQFYFREMDDDEIDFDSFFNIKDDESLVRLRDLLTKEGMYSDEEFNNTYGEVFIKHCKDSSSNSVINLNGNISDILDVSSKLFENYLDKAVSNSPVVLDDGSLISKISYEGVDHSVEVKLDEFGKIKELKFLDKELAEKSGLKIKKVSEGGESSFKIVSELDSKEIDQFFFVMEETDLESSPNKGVLAIYVKGASEKDPLGKFHYDKNIYPVKFSDKGIISANSRIRLSSDRVANYPTDFRKGDGKAISSFFFENFYTTKGRKKKIANEIRKEAISTSKGLNKDGAILLTNTEINSAIDLIVDDVERDHRKLRGDVSTLTASVYQHAYDRFSQIVVPKMIKGMMPGEKEEVYKGITDKAMVDFRKCLKSFADVSNTSGAAKCMSSFEKEAPIVIGREILALQLGQNGYDQLSEKAKNEYDQCIKEQYDTKAEDLDLIKACIFKATFKTVDNDLNDIINLTLKDMSQDLDPSGKKSLSVAPPSIIQSRRILRDCYVSKGYMKPRVFTDNYDINKLKNLEVESFKQGLFTCASRVEEVVATEITGQFVEEALRDAGVDDSQIKLISEDVLKNGLNYCIDAQKKRVEILAQSGKHSVVKASSCKSYITLYAGQKVIDLSLEEKVGNPLWTSIKEKSPNKSCFEKSKKLALSQVLEGKENALDADLESTKCLKETIHWVSYFLAKSELEKIFKSDPMYRNVKLSNEKKDFYAKSLQSCFKEKLKDFNTLSEVTDNLDKVQDSCTVNLVMSDEARRDILTPVVEGMLEDNGVEKETSNKLVDSIVSSMHSKAKKDLETRDLTLDELVEGFKEVKGEAVYLVADATIDGYVKDFVDDPIKANILSKELRRDIFEGKSGYRSVLTSEKDDDKIEAHIQSMTREAAIKLTSIVTQEEAKKLLDAGTLKTQAEVDKITKAAPVIMKTCLDNFKTGDFNEHVAACILETKAQVTRNVFKDQLTSILNDSEYSDHFSEKEKQEILNTHINPKLKEDITKAYKEDSLDKFIENFTLKATISAATPVLKGSVAEVIYGKGVSESQAPASKVALVNRVTEESGKFLEKCLRDNLKNKKSKSEDTNECINKVRVDATGIILGDILNDIASHIDKDSSSRSELVNNHVNFLERCSKLNGTNVESVKFSNRINSCLVENIFNFTANSVKHLSKRSDYLDPITDKQLEDYKNCIIDRKIDFVKNLKDKGISLQRRNNLYSEIKTGVSFWEKVFSLNEFASSDDSTKNILDWTVDSVKICATSNVTKAVLGSLMTSNKSKRALNLNGSESKFALEITGKIEKFAEKEFGEKFWLDLSSNNSVKESGNVTPSSKSDKTDTRKDISDYINTIMPKVGDYIKKLHGFDKNRALKDLDKLLKEISQAKSNKDLSIDDLKEILLNSELIDTVLMSEIRGFIKLEAATALSAEGLNAHDINKIVSPRIIKGLFDKGNPEGQKILKNFKDRYIGPLLNGEKVKEIPKDIVRDVKVHLSKDTKMGGFVETLAGAIVQKTLNEKRPKNLASQGFAGLIGYDDADFKWSSLRSRTEPGIAQKDQPVQKAIEYFGEKILKPTLLKQNLGDNVEVGFFGGVTKTPIIDMRKEEFAEQVEGLISLDE